MTNRYVGPGGNDGNSGLTWILRKLTLTGVENTVAAGDDVYVGPGVYRERLAAWVSGGSAYSAGTVTVTDGSTTVTGAGTAFLANVAVADMFHVKLYASAADGVANGTATFTSAGGNFQAAMIGQVIQIMTRGAYRIGAVAAANSITLTDPNGLGWPGAGGGLTYSVMSGQGPYEILSITDNTNFELVRPWYGPTLTGIAYVAYLPIRYIADVTGENTDSVGGIVRWTGSDNDQTRVRTNCISSGQDYRLFRGFRFDMAYEAAVVLDAATHWVIEDCTLIHNAVGVHVENAGQENITIRRCMLVMNEHQPVYVWNDATVDDSGHLIENCLVVSTKPWDRGIYSTRIGGITVRNYGVFGTYVGIGVPIALALGQTVAVEHSYFVNADVGLVATAAGEITENHNSFFDNNTNRTNTATGANSVNYPPLLSLPLLHSGADHASGFKFPWWFGELSEWSQIRAITGFDEAPIDMMGIQRPVTAAKNSWGPIQFHDMERETTTTRGASAASLKFADAARWQMWVPVTDTSTTISVYVYREANYAGNLPQMIVKQPGVADDITTDVAAAVQWNLLTTTLTPAANPPYIVVELISRNTAAAGAFDTFFDDLAVS